MKYSENQVIVNYAKSLPYAKVYYRQDWNVIYFDIFGKMFGLLSPETSLTPTLSLKNTPEQNEEWRTIYPDSIVPGYHLNKKHWNTLTLLKLNLSEDNLTKLIKVSYDLVCCNLKKEQKILVKQVLDELP